MTVFFFDPSSAEDITVNPLKDGPNTATIADVKLLRTQAGTGSYLEISYDIKGTMIKDRLTTENPNPTAVKMGLGKLKKIYAICGLGAADALKLIGKKLTVVLEYKQNEQTGKRYLDPIDYISLNGNRECAQAPSNSPSTYHPYAPGSREFPPF